MLIHSSEYSTSESYIVVERGWRVAFKEATRMRHYTSPLGPNTVHGSVYGPEIRVTCILKQGSSVKQPGTLRDSNSKKGLLIA